MSRHGRVRKKNSLLAEYDSLDSLDKPRKKYEKDKTPRKAPGTPKVGTISCWYCNYELNIGYA